MPKTQFFEKSPMVPFLIAGHVCGRQSHVENEHYCVFNSISSPNIMLSQLKPEVGLSLADRLKLLKPKFEVSGRFHTRVTIM